MRLQSSEPDENRVEHSGTKAYWEGQAARDSGDPRSVTLAKVPSPLARLEVSLYQGWAMRAIDAQTPGRSLALDLGCGLGTWTPLLAARADRVHAVDFSEGFVATTQQRCVDGGIADRVTVEQCDLVVYELPSEVDIVVAGAVVQYLSDEEVRGLFRRIRNALAPGGVFYLRTTIGKRKTVTKRDGNFTGIYRPIGWYLDALAESGLSVVRHRTATRFLPDELDHRWYIGWLFLPFWWLVRAHNNTDVCAFLCRAR